MMMMMIYDNERNTIHSSQRYDGNRVLVPSLLTTAEVPLRPRCRYSRFKSSD